MEDLEINPLHRAFVTKFRGEFDIACKMSYVIAIPHSDTLDNVEIDQYFANTHILVPSKLLRQHYTPLQIGYFEDIEIDGKKLICYLGKSRPVDKIVVSILAEEIGYNSLNREYKTILIDRPLLSFNTRPLIRSLLAPLTPRSIITAASSRLSLLKQRRISNARGLNHHDDCSRYLDYISPSLTSLLEEDIRRLQTNYIILSHYIDDAASRTRQLAENYIPKYEMALEENAFHLTDSVSDSIKMSVENYIVHLLHGKLIVALQNLYAKEDKTLLDKFELIRQTNSSISELGAQEVFSEFSLSAELTRALRSLPSLQSPIAMVTCIIKAVNMITELLTQSTKFKRLLETDGDQRRQRGPDYSAIVNCCSWAPQQQLSPKVATICSDDLIATLIFALAQAKPENLFSTMRYLETFGSSSTAKDQAAYYTATIQLVVQYTLDYESSEASASPVAAARRTPPAGAMQTNP